MHYRKSTRRDAKSEAVLDMLKSGCKVANVPWDYRGLVLPMLAAGNVIIAFTDNYEYQPVGFVFYIEQVMPDTQRLAVIERLLFVLPENRGKTLGVGKGLLDTLVRIAREDGALDIFAGSSLDNNEHTKRLYEGAGFKTTYAFKKEL